MSAYRVCKTRIQDSGLSTIFTQQWDKMEEWGYLKIDSEADYIRPYNNHQQMEGKKL